MQYLPSVPSLRINAADAGDGVPNRKFGTVKEADRHKFSGMAFSEQPDFSEKSGCSESPKTFDCAEKNLITHF